jgi:hypothetical protein
MIQVGSRYEGSVICNKCKKEMRCLTPKKDAVAKLHCSDGLCPRCGEPVERFPGLNRIHGKIAHRQCVLDEMDEDGMDDFHGANG